jgi:hypothetical protein
MFPNDVDGMGTASRRAWLWRRVALPLLIALLAFGFVGVSTTAAHSSAPLRPATVSHEYADAAPAMSVLNGTIYVGWTGRNAAHNLNLMTYTPATKSFGPAQVLTDTTLVGAEPSLDNFNGHLYVAWLGTDHRLNIGRYNPADPTHLANKVTLREYSNTAPSIATQPISGTPTFRLYLSWRGTDGRLNIISSADGSTFNTKVTYGITVRTSPSLVSADMYLYVFWEDVSASSPIVVGRYNPANPASLSPVVTLTATSQLPVGVAKAGVAAPDVVVAWRTASDAHIQLGVFVGGPVLSNALTTAQTTPYGPALFEPFMSWTGTDAARSVNVSPSNL